MAYLPGPRNKAAQIAANPFTTTTVWAPSTAYGAGATFTNGGNTYSTPTAFTSGATFSATGLTLIAQAGATGAAAPALSFPFTTDGVASSFTVTHNQNTRALTPSVEDPNDSFAVIPGLDFTFPTVNTTTVIFGGPPAATTLNLVLV